MARPSIGANAALVVAATALVVSTAIGLLVHHLTASAQLATARADLDGRLLNDAYDYAAGRQSPARINPADLPGPLTRAVRANVRVTYIQSGRHPVLWAATRVSDHDVLALSRSYRPETRALASLDRTLVAVGGTATVVVSLAGLLLGVRMGRRATAAARTAERIADGELDARVDPRGRDEIARLAASVNTMADALGARLEAERRVTADIAHELRTPVAGMSTAAGLLPPGPATELIRRSVQNLRGLVEDVLEVARMDAQVVAPETEERQVSAMARRAVAGLDQVEVRVSADAVVTTDPRRVERILANLASNVTTESTMLGMENYNDLARRGNVALNAVGISTSSLEQSVRDLATGGSNRAMTQSTARALLRLIIAVSEGTRFRPLATQVAGAINNGGTFTTGDRYVVLIRDWDGISTVYRDHLDNPSSTTGHTVQGWGSVNSVATAAALLLAAMGAGSMSFPKTEL